MILCKNCGMKAHEHKWGECQNGSNKNLDSFHVPPTTIQVTGLTDEHPSLIFIKDIDNIKVYGIDSDKLEDEVKAIMEVKDRDSVCVIYRTGYSPAMVMESLDLLQRQIEGLD